MRSYLKLHDLFGQELFVSADAVDIFGFDSVNDTAYLYRTGMKEPIRIKESLEDLSLMLGISERMVQKNGK